MAGKVVDPSAIGALLFAEPQADHIARQLSTGPLVAPALLWFEVANIRVKK